MMSFRGVNKELGHNKQNYSLLKFKGGKIVIIITALSTLAGGLWGGNGG